MEIHIKTLTPLWTGGIETGKVDRIHETGLLGSLRWWMEVLVRGMGGQVCDPTEQKCSYDSKKPNNGLCKVCEVFGATGWKRQFRPEVIRDNTKPDTQVSSEIKLKSYQCKNKNGEMATGTPQWYFPKNSQDKPREGEFTLKIQSLNPKFKPEIIGGLIQFIADYSALGARPQMGFGVIKIESDRIDTKPLCDWLQKIPQTPNNFQDLPSLKNIFLAQIQTKDAEFDEKSTFNLKYDLRQFFRTHQQQSITNSNKPILKKDKEQELRHFIMGAAPKDSDNDSNSENKEDKRMAAKVKVSRPYTDEKGNKIMRVWGWIPQQSNFYNNQWDRDKILSKIHQHLSNEYTLTLWRELDSERDTTKTPNPKEIDQFLHSLLRFSDNKND